MPGRQQRSSEPPASSAECRPLGGSTISDVRAPVRLTETNSRCRRRRRPIRFPAPRACRGPAFRIAALSNSARCASVKNSWLAYLGERCSGVWFRRSRCPADRVRPKAFSARAQLREPEPMFARRDTAMTALKAAAAIASVIVEPKKRSRMMLSPSPLRSYCSGSWSSNPDALSLVSGSGPLPCAKARSSRRAVRMIVGKPIFPSMQRGSE